MKKNQLRLLSLFCLLVFISIAAVKFCDSISLRSDFHDSSLLSSQSSDTFYSKSNSNSSIPFSDKDIAVLIEEIEENEDTNEKDDLLVLAFTYLFRTLNFTEKENHYFIFQPENGSVFSIPLHIKNCIYLI